MKAKNIIDGEEAKTWWNGLNQKQRDVYSRMSTDVDVCFAKFSGPDINGFFFEHRYLSNYHECEIRFEGLTYGSTEAAYQAAKTLDLTDRERFTRMSPSESKKAGQLLKLRPDWDSMKYHFMETVLKEKFTRHENLKRRLLASGQVRLEETNWWGDRVWGVSMLRGEWKGENHLGSLLMEIRNFI